MRLRWSSSSARLPSIRRRRLGAWPTVGAAFLLSALSGPVAGPAKAAVYATDGVAMAAICQENALRFPPGEYGQAIAALRLGAFAAGGEALVGDAGAAARQAEFNAALAKLRSCMIQAQLARVILDAQSGCSALIDVHLRFEQVIAISEGHGIPIARTPLEAAIQPAIEKCWDELTSRCLDFSNREEVQRVSGVLEVARWASIPRSYLVPPLQSCSRTVPECRANEAAETCTPYLQAAANILFGGQNLNELLPR